VELYLHSPIRLDGIIFTVEDRNTLVAVPVLSVVRTATSQGNAPYAPRIAWYASVLLRVLWSGRSREEKEISPLAGSS